MENDINKTDILITNDNLQEDNKKEIENMIKENMEVILTTKQNTQEDIETKNEHTVQENSTETSLVTKDNNTQEDIENKSECMFQENSENSSLITIDNTHEGIEKSIEPVVENKESSVATEVNTQDHNDTKIENTVEENKEGSNLATNDNTQNNIENSTVEYIRSKLFVNNSLVELSKSHWSRSKKVNSKVQPYLRGCKWSPDGTTCLCVVNDDGMHLIDLPKELHTDKIAADRPTDVLNSEVHVKESGLVYDFCWYPGTNFNYPETCCWLTTIQNSPIQLWDGYSGSLRATYRGFNAVDEMEPAISVTFSSNASLIFGGYKKCLRIFNVNRPGREYTEVKVNSPASCLVSNDDVLAVGSWNTSITMFSPNKGGAYKSIMQIKGHTGGVTHMCFSSDGVKLVSGARKDHRLLIWDIRNIRVPIKTLSRVVDTNQRIFFDLSPCEKYLVSGGTDGIVKVWDFNAAVLSELSVDPLLYKFPIHKDCCNGVSVHPYRSILATSSGQYHFEVPLELMEEDEVTTVDEVKDLTSETQEKESEEAIVRNNKVSDKDFTEVKYSSVSENSLAYWWIGEGGFNANN